MKSRIIAVLTGLILMAVGSAAQTANSLIIPDMEAQLGSTVSLPVVMENTAEVVAVQLTIEVPDGVTLNPQQVAKSERLDNHTVSVREVSHGKYTFIILSADNEPIGGSDGQLFTIAMWISTQLYEGRTYPLTISEAAMSLRTGENVIEGTNNGKLTIKGGPNLHVTSLYCSEPVAGQTLTVRWTVRNDGHGDTEDVEWKDYLWLVPNISIGTSMEGSRLLATVGNISALGIGESYESTVNVTLPERIYGNYDLVVTSNMYGVNNIDFSAAGGAPPIPYDPENDGYGFLIANGNANYVTVQEENEFNGVSDNFFYKRINIQVPPLPDIQVPRVVAVVDNDNPDLTPSPLNSAGLVSSSAFYSGKKVKVTATIANNGGADINGTTISNVLYISNTPDLTSGKTLWMSAHSMQLSLKAGESANDEFTVTIPYDWYGDTYFIVDADENDAVYELANTANNSGVTDLINTLLTPGADFEPYNLNVPQRISSGMKFDISYSVRNIGPGVPFSNTWTDKVYISSKNTGLDDSALLIGQFTQRGVYKMVSDGHVDGGEYLYEGDNYSATRSLNVNGLQTGTYYIYVVVDADNAVLEYDGENNNALMSKAVTLSTPDLTAEIVSISEEILSTNTKVAVAWKLKNIGTADIQNVTVKDGFFAGSNTNGANAVSLGTATNTVSIVAGGEKTFRTNITIPMNSTLNGTRYFFVKTNIDNTVDESSTTNNASAAVVKEFVYVDDPTKIKVDGINLTVYSLQVTSSATPGESVPFTYQVKNTGSLTIGREVTQEIFISKSSTFDSSAKVLTVTGSLPNLSGLQAGATVQANVSITIPQDMKGGQNYIYVVINGDNALAEKKYDDNQQKSPIFVNGNLPNLVVSNLTAPATIMTSKKTELSWTIANTGNWEADAINCKIYLSDDATFSQNDILLANASINKLSKDSSEELKATIELEDHVVGSYYMIVKVDDVQEETSTEDNIAVSAFTATQSPLPDLTIADLTSEGTWRGGQTVTIKAKVTNTGDDVTHKDKWTDMFYLSEGYTLDVNKAIKLGSKTHVGSVKKEDSYQIAANFTIPASAKGYYVLVAVADGTNAMTEKNKENNQTEMTVYMEDPKDTPADLAVSRINAPARIMAGENITISYNITNQGEYVAKGKLRDVLYMSKDNRWDQNDPMVGVVTGEVEINPGTEITRSVTGRITNMPEGNYFLIVRTNSTHAIAETNYDNNQTIQQSASSVAFASLSLGGAVTVNTSGLYKLPLHSGLNGKTIGLTLTTPENVSAGLYTAFDDVPSTARYDRSASDIEATQQEVLIPDVQEGTYYILAQDNAAVSRNLNEFIIDGEQDTEETTMTLTAREVQFGATTLSIKEGGTNGWISTEIHGALLDSIMDFRLARDGEMIPAEAISFYDQTSSKATFNLNDAQTGSYDVVSELPDGTQATLPDGFKVIPGINANLGVKIDAPHWTHIESPVPVTIAYANGGNTDIVIRGLLFNCDGGDVGMTIEDLQKHEHTLSFKPKGMSDSRGFITIPPGTQETIRCYFKQYQTGVCYMRVYVIK